jgi:hypothetical protein
MSTSLNTVAQTPEKFFIEIKRYRRLQAQIIFISLITLGWDLLLIYGVTLGSLENRSLEALPFLVLFIFFLIGFLYALRTMTIKVIRLESTEDGFRATTLIMKSIDFTAEEVVTVLDGYAHFMLILSDGRKMDFDKTDSYSFSTIYFRRLDNHPWLPFMTKSRFVRARYESKRIPW